jgi:hypothetical protein
METTMADSHIDKSRVPIPHLTFWPQMAGARFLFRGCVAEAHVTAYLDGYRLTEQAGHNAAITEFFACVQLLLTCHVKGHDFINDGACAESGREDFSCNRCGLSWTAWM